MVKKIILEALEAGDAGLGRGKRLHFAFRDRILVKLDSESQDARI